MNKFINKCDGLNVFMLHCTASVHPDRRADSNRCNKAFPHCCCMHGSHPVTPAAHHPMATTCHTEIRWSKAQAVTITWQCCSCFLLPTVPGKKKKKRGNPPQSLLSCCFPPVIIVIIIIKSSALRVWLKPNAHNWEEKGTPRRQSPYIISTQHNLIWTTIPIILFR